MLPPTTICIDNNWAELVVKRKARYNHLEPFDLCILPNGIYYYPWDLELKKDSKYKELFDQYSGQYPTFDQIQKAKEQMRKDGYIVD